MREPLLELIRCPDCAGQQFRLEVAERDDLEIRSALVTCTGCAGEHRCERGILDLLKVANAQITSERSGWAELAGYVKNSDRLMLELPDPTDEPHRTDWLSQSQNFHYMWSQLELRGDEKVLDLGAGRCWTTRRFAQQGCYAVGLDVVLTKYVGLETADLFIREDGKPFDRVCADMNAVPLRDGVFDIVFLSATLHHTSSPDTVLGEVNRVLKPGGKLVMINEPVVGLGRSTELHCVEKERGINENVYRLPLYLGALRRAGLHARLYPYIGGYSPVIAGVNRSLQHRVPRLRQWRMLPPLLYAQHLLGRGILNVVATKPALSAN